MNEEEEMKLMEETSAINKDRDFPWGKGDNDNYWNKCWSCKLDYRGHKRSATCRQCSKLKTTPHPTHLDDMDITQLKKELADRQRSLESYQQMVDVVQKRIDVMDCS